MAEGQKAALFVDFDNIYSGLHRIDPQLAERFAQHPDRWLAWLTQGAARGGAQESAERRRILVRRTYLNPQVYGRYRSAALHAGFEVVDCPPMTMQGKTSTDMHMVLDIVDLLQHPVHIDEFIVLSADADFTPVLRKLRRWDRRTTVLAIGTPSSAYRANADALIDQDEFCEFALAARVAESLAPVAMPPRAPAPEPPLPATATSGSPSAAQATTEAEHRVRQWLQVLLRDSAGPISCARLAQMTREQFPEAGIDWLGRKNFRKLLEALAPAQLHFDWLRDGGLAWHDRHERSATPGEPRTAPPLAPTTPLPSAYQALPLPQLSAQELAGLMEHLLLDLRAEPYELSGTGKRVRTRCQQAGLPISRKDVNDVLRSIALGGCDLSAPVAVIDPLRRAYLNSILALAKRDQLLCTADDEAALRRWLGLPLA